MKNASIGLLLSVLFLTTPSCKKYEEGPYVSLRSKTERVANNWRVEKAMNGNTDITSDFERYEIIFTTSNRASIIAAYKFFGTTYAYITEGTWSFNGNKEKLIVDYENNEADRVYFILRLSEDEMWLREEGSALELHLVTR